MFATGDSKRARLLRIGIFVALAIAASGLHGVVVRGPTKPVCQVAMPCNAPAAGVVLSFSRGGRVVARVRSGADGRYSVRLGPGLYAVSVAPVPKIGAGLQPRAVRVRRGVDAVQSFTIDTGIR